MVVKMFTKSLAETVTYDIHNPSQVKSFLAHRQEGVFGFENYLTNDVCRYYFFANPLELVHQSKTKPVLLDKNRMDVDCYNIMFHYLSFLPFHFNLEECFWELIGKYVSRIARNSIVLTQVVFKYQSHEEWKSKAYDLYNAYLDGVYAPSSIPMVKNWQYKLSKLFGNPKPYPIPEATKKYEQRGYHTCMRIAIYGDDAERVKIIERIRLALSHMNHVNRWRISREKNKEKFIKTMQLREMSPLDQILVPSEMITFFGGYQGKDVEGQEISNLVEVDRQNIQINPSDIEILPSVKSSKLNQKDKEIIAEITSAMIRCKLLKNSSDMVVTNVTEGVTLKFIEFLRPEYLEVKKIDNRIRDLEIELGVDGLKIGKGDKRGTLKFSYPRTTRTFVDLAELLYSQDFDKKAHDYELPIIVGVDMLGKPIFYDLAKLVHLLIAGATGNGKSVFLTSLLLSLMWHRSPKDLELTLIDLKRIELTDFMDLPHAKRIATTPKKALAYLAKLTKEMEDRYKIMEKLKKEKGLKLKGIADYNKHFPDEKWQYKVCVIDEFAELILSEKEVEDLVQRLNQLGRASGIHVIIATQRPSVDVITGIIKTNMPCRIGFTCTSDVDYRTIFDHKPPFTMYGDGDGAVKWHGNKGQDFVRFQSPMNHDEKIYDKIISKWGENDGYDEIEDEDALLDSLDKKYMELKRIIAKTGETKLTSLKPLLNVKGTKLQEYFDKLVEEGWLNQPESKKKGYTINISEAERLKFLSEYEEE